MENNDCKCEGCGNPYPTMRIEDVMGNPLCDACVPELDASEFLDDTVLNPEY